MSEHRVKQNGIIYIIPNDELYQKYIKNEAFIDDYGRLMNRRPNRVLKELKHIGDDRPVVLVQPQEDHPIRDAIKETMAESLREVIYKGTDLLVYDAMPKLWHYKLKPGIKRMYHSVISGKRTKAETIIEKKQTAKRVSTAQLVKKPETDKQKKTSMTEEEILIEQKKAIIHYIGLLESLRRLHEAGKIDDVNKNLEQLINPAAIESFNKTLSANPNLLEMTQHIQVTALLGRNLFQNGIYVPLQQEEIKLLVK